MNNAVSSEAVLNEMGRICIIIGLVFDFFGTIALLRFPDVYTRLQASAKCVLMGTCAILAGVLLSLPVSEASFKAFLVICFLMLSTPVSVHVLIRGAYKSGVPLSEGAVCDQYGEKHS